MLVTPRRSEHTEFEGTLLRRPKVAHPNFAKGVFELSERGAPWIESVGPSMLKDAALVEEILNLVGHRADRVGSRRMVAPRYDGAFQLERTKMQALGARIEG